MALLLQPPEAGLLGREAKAFERLLHIAYPCTI
jgi:hypothetical protein